MQQDTQVLKKLLDKLTICTHSGIVNAGKHMASFSALKTTSKKWKDAAQKTGRDCFAYARAFVVLIAARIGRSGCSVWENHAVSIDGKIYHGIPDFDMVRFPITEMSHVLFKGFVSKVVGKIIKGLSVIQRGVASMRCIDCCVDRGEERVYLRHSQSPWINGSTLLGKLILVHHVVGFFSKDKVLALDALYSAVWLDDFP